MGDKSQHPISDRQAAARRENGKKSRGPVTPDGKRKSSMNSTKHAYYARGLMVIEAGPLREDQWEYEQFIEQVVLDLNPSDNFLLRQASLDVADKAWRLTRAQRWETYGYSRPDIDSGLNDERSAQADVLVNFATSDRGHAAIVRRLEDPTLTADDIWGPYCALAFLLGATEETFEMSESADFSTKMEGLLALIDENYDSAEDAAMALDSRAADREQEAKDLYWLVIPDVIRKEVGNGFAKNAERLVTHASREYDRSLARYFKLRDQLSNTPQPSNPGVENPRDDGTSPSTTPVRRGPRGGDSSSEALQIIESAMDDLLSARLENRH